MGKLDINNPVDMATKVAQWFAMGNDDLADVLVTNLMQNKGFTKLVKDKFGHIPVKNPHANWEKMMYVPTSFKNKPDPNNPDGPGIPPSDEDMAKAVWRSISARNIIGDILTGLGAAGNILANINAGTLKNNARISASDRQRELYGATPEDRAAAAMIPAYQGIGNMQQLFTSIAANRLYQDAAERRAAYLRAMMGAEHNNMGVSGMYSDSWRKAQDQIATPPVTPAIGGQK